MKKFIRSFVLWSLLLWWVQQWFTQNTTTKQTKKEAVEVLMDDHNTIIHKNIPDIIQIYGLERGLEIVKEHMLISINNHREAIGLSPLKTNIYLTNSAQQHAEFLRKNKEKYFEHTWDIATMPNAHVQYLPNNTTKILVERTMEAGYQDSFVKEILHYGKTTIASVVAAWLNSTWHKSILEDPKLLDVGIGIAENIYVINFGKRDGKHRTIKFQKAGK